MLRRLQAGFQHLSASTPTWVPKRNTSQRSVRHKVPKIARMLQNEDWARLRYQSPLILRWFLAEAVLRKRLPSHIVRYRTDHPCWRTSRVDRLAVDISQTSDRVPACEAGNVNPA